MLLYIATAALVAVAMLVPFAIVGEAQAIFGFDDLGEVLCFLIVGLLTARVAGLILVPRRPMR
jgi:hypothetical protein